MTIMTPITDEELVAYLDGELDAARRSEIDSALTADQQLAARLTALEIDKGTLGAALDAATAAAPLGKLRAFLDQQPAPTIAPRRAVPTWLKIAAALLLGLALGYGVSRGTADDPAADWRLAVADYHVLYSTATLASVADNATEQREEVANVAAMLGLPVKFDALQVPGLNFKRAQLLSFNGRPLAQFAYLGPASVPIAFCATRTGEADSTIHTAKFHGLTAAYWSKNGYGFIIIGDAPDTVLRQAAERLVQQI